MFNKNIQEVNQPLYEERELEGIWSKDKKGDIKDIVAIVEMLITPSITIFRIRFWRELDNIKTDK